jgi:hypothetical protein
LVPTSYSVTKANQNEALLWKIAVLGMEKPPVGIEVCKMFPNQQGDFPFPELQFSRGELHFN